MPDAALTTRSLRAVPRPRDVALDEDMIGKGIAPFGSDFLGARRILAYLLLTFVLLPVQIALVALRSRGAESFPVFYHRLCARLMGVDVHTVGTVSRARPTLFVSNHTSYIDITVLGSVVPASFVAKAEVANWPLYGLLAKLQRTVFVDRKRQSSHRHRDQLQERLKAGDNLILFPEGTSNDGNRVLPFRSALLSVAETPLEDVSLTIQPVSIAYIGLNGIPMGHGLRPLVAWYGDMSLGPHLWQFSRLGKVTVVVEFHKPIDLKAIGSRKDLARYCLNAVAGGVERALTGRALAPVEAPPKQH
ncbi:MAG TPA: lysophospholipid acyltransferase family protein [Candidatus Cybelea sp.]|nr:lysophospholipid acyltransferase family protein [Candidatus Cybelea sp.]